MPKRVGILIGGSDCPAINTIIDAIVKSLGVDWEVIGFYNGFEGLLSKNYLLLDRMYTSQNRWIGGSLLKSGMNGNFPTSSDAAFDSQELELVEKAYQTYEELDLDGLVVIGGDSTLRVANKLTSYGFNIIAIPKSIENDLECTDLSIGFQTAVDIADDALARLHTSAYSRDQVMVLEVLGMNSGWIALEAGISGGANMILIPEIPFKYNSIGDFIDNRFNKRNKSTIIIVSDSAQGEDEGDYFDTFIRDTSTKKYFSTGEKITDYINRSTGYQALCTNIGNLQRGGSPNAFDKVLATQLGAFTAATTIDCQWNKVITISGGEFRTGVLDQNVCKLHLVDAQGQKVELAKQIGICFGE